MSAIERRAQAKADRAGIKRYKDKWLSSEAKYQPIHGALQDADRKYPGTIEHVAEVLNLEVERMRKAERRKRRKR